MTTKAHSPLGPSVFYRRMVCPGSLSLEPLFPSAPSDESNIGTQLHKLLEEDADIIDPKKYPEIASNDWHIEAYRYAIEFQRQLVELHPTHKIHRELKVDLTSIHKEIGFGTCDFALIRHYDSAIIIDWKFFFQKGLKAADENRQIALYAAGIAEKYELEFVKAYIVCPHIKAHSEVEFAKDDLDYIVKTYNIHAQSIIGNPFHFQGGDHCKNCKALALCPVWIQKALSLESGKLEGATHEEISKLLIKGEGVSDWYGELKQLAVKIISAGGKIPLWGLFAGRNFRFWTKENQELEKALTKAAKKLGEDAKSIWVEPEIKSPAKMENEWGKSKKVKDELDKLIATKAGALVLRKVLEEKESKK